MPPVSDLILEARPGVEPGLEALHSDRVAVPPPSPPHGNSRPSVRIEARLAVT